MSNNQSFIKLLFVGLKKSSHRIFISIFKTIISIILIIATIIGLTFFYEKTDNYDASLIGMSKQNIEYCYAANDKYRDVMLKIDEFINNQPEYIKERFFEQEWKIVISKEIPENFLDSITVIGVDTNSENIVGLTVPKSKIIYLSCDKKTQENIYLNFLHEFGHCYDYFVGYGSVTYKFEKLYEESVDRVLFSEYELSSSTEFFATAYSIYKNTPTVLESAVPDVCDYFIKSEKIIEKYDLRYLINIKGMIEEAKILVRDIIKKTIDFTF